MSEALTIRVREILAADFEDGRLDGVADDQQLLKAGLINSLEMVSVSVALEIGFGVKIPANVVTPENYATLNTIASLMARLSGQGGREAIAEKDHPLAVSLLGALRRPLLWICATVIFLVLSDIGLRLLIEGPLGKDWTSFTENGARMYPLSGNHAQESFAFTARKHAITTASPDDRYRIAFFGDSGTHGSWVPYAEALPQQTEDRLHEHGLDTRIFNLAYFIPSTSKDLMIMGAVRNANQGRLPADMVVLTVSDEYFSRQQFGSNASTYQHVSANAQLMAAAKPMFDSESQATIDRVSKDIRARGKHLQPWWEHWLRANAALLQYGPYIQHLLNRLVYTPTGRQRYNVNDEMAVGRKPHWEKVLPYPPERFRVMYNGLPQEDVHPDLVTIYQGMLDGFRRADIPVVVYLKPLAPKEWKAFLQPPAGTWTVASALKSWCQPTTCRVADARWVLDGTQFSDSLAHYTVEGNLRVSVVVATEIEALKRERTK